MSRSPRSPNPPRNERRHEPDRERSRKWMFKEGSNEEYDELKRKAKRKVHKWAITFVKCAALQRPLWKPPSQPPSSSHKRRRKHNRHQLHRERSPEPKGRHRRHHASRRDLSDAPSDESDSDDGYNSDLNEGLSNPDIDHYEGRDVAIPSNPEGRLTASLPNPRSHSPLTGLKHAPADPVGDCAKDCRDGSPSLHDSLDPAPDDTASDSGESRVGDHCGTPPSSLETSRHEDEGNTLGSCSYDLDGDQEYNVCQTATRLHKVAHVHLGGTSSKSHESEDEDPVTDLGDIPVDTPSENEGEVDDSLVQDEGYASMSRETSPEEPETASIIASIAPASPQGDVSGPGQSKAELAASNSSPGAETHGPQPHSSSSAKPPIDFSPGSIVKRKGIMKEFRGRWKPDCHPYLITRNILDDDGEIVAVMACLGTSRPKLDLFTEQYKEQKKKHFCYLGGIEEGDFVTPEDTPKPTVAELDIQGPPMPKKTYLGLEEEGPFDLGDFKSLTGQPRLTDTSREKFLNLYTPALHGCKKSPPGSVPAAQPEILM